MSLPRGEDSPHFKDLLSSVTGLSPNVSPTGIVRRVGPARPVNVALGVQGLSVFNLWVKYSGLLGGVKFFWFTLLCYEETSPPHPLTSVPKARLQQVFQQRASAPYCKNRRDSNFQAGRKLTGLLRDF